jgi:hypothetical protein
MSVSNAAAIAKSHGGLQFCGILHQPGSGSQTAGQAKSISINQYGFRFSANAS